MRLAAKNLYYKMLYVCERYPLCIASINMSYKSKYVCFDLSGIQTYPIRTRTNKVKLNDLLEPQDALALQYEVADETMETLRALGKAVCQARNLNKPVIPRQPDLTVPALLPGNNPFVIGSI